MKKGKYLITGCAGFIGSNLVKNIYKKHEIILVDDLSEGSVLNLPKILRKKIVIKKIQDIKKLKVSKLSGIFHLAAQASVPLSLSDFYKSSTNNIESSLKVFELSKQFSAPVVYASSSAIYGNLHLGNDQKENFSIMSPYAQDKLTIEHYAEMLFKIFKISSVGLRLFNVYGPGQKSNSPYSGVIPIFINRMLKKLPVVINGGFQTRDFVYVQDVINVMLLSMEKIQKKKSFQIFNFGSGRSVKIDFLFKLIEKNIGTNSKIIRHKLDKFDPKKSLGTYKKIYKYLNLKKYNCTKLENGIITTINSIKFNQ
jgi:nucleoside-diphosphate-sugar epimerase